MNEYREISPAELGETRPYMSPQERGIVDSLSVSQKELVKELHRPNLTKYKSQIVGIRSEDLYFFLSCVQQGYIPVGKHLIRDKNDVVPMLFVSPNPESNLLDTTAPNFRKNLNYSKFAEIANENNSLYGNIGIIQGIYRNLIKTGDLTQIEQLATEYLRNVDPGDDFSNPAHCIEVYFANLASDLKKQDIINFEKSNRNRFAIELMGKYLPPELHSQALKILNGVKDRQSILIAFNEKILGYEVKTDLGYVDTPEEIVFLAPENKISIDTVMGFETQGDYEDEIIEQL